MLCEHLSAFEQEVLSKGFQPTYGGQAWSSVRHWVYFDCYFDIESIRQRHQFADCVVDHEHQSTHDGQEHGLYCTKCKDGIMGHHLRYAEGKQVYK